MQAMEMITNRKSCRAFISEPIPRHIMQEVLEAARNSPSYTNTQPWEVAVVTGKKKDELSLQLMKKAKEKAPITPDIPVPGHWPLEIEKRQQEHGKRRLNTLGVERGDQEGREALRLRNYEFYGAPCALFLFMDGRLGEWSTYDLGLYTQTLILAAHSLGVASCIQASVTNYAKEIKEFLGIEMGKKLLVCISMGYADPHAKLNTYRSLKKSPQECVSWYE